MIAEQTPPLDITEPADEPSPGWGQKAVMLFLTVIPFLGILAAITLLWDSAVGWTDLLLLVSLYVLCGFGVKPVGWEQVLPGHPTLGDVDSAEALAEYQAMKRAYKQQVRARRERTT